MVSEVADYITNAKEQKFSFIQNTKDKKLGFVTGIKDDFVNGYDQYQHQFLPKIKGFFEQKQDKAMDTFNSYFSPEGLVFLGTAMVMMMSLMHKGDRRKRSAPLGGNLGSIPLAMPSESAEHFVKVLSLLDQDDCISTAFCESAYNNPTDRGDREISVLRALGIQLGGAMPWNGEEENARSKYQYAEYVGYTSRQLRKKDGCRKVFPKCKIPTRVLLNMIEQKYNVCEAFAPRRLS